MNDRDLYSRIPGIERPWSVTEVRLDIRAREVVVRVAADPGARLVCPRCGNDASRYDTRSRRWRHVDTCQLRTILEADLPGVERATDGV